MKLYYRYIFNNLFTTSLIITTIFTLILWSIDMFIADQEGLVISFLGVIGFIKLCSMLIPHNMALIWPISIFFGILISIHQMQNKGEFLSFRYLGLSHAKIFSPILLFAICSTIIGYVVMIEIAPRLYKEYRIQKSDIVQRAILSLLHKKKFNKFNDSIIYFEDINKDGFAENIIIWQTNTDKTSVLINAEYLMFTKKNDYTTMVVLQNANIYEINNDGKESFIHNRKEMQVSLQYLLKMKKKDPYNNVYSYSGLQKLYIESHYSSSAFRELHNRILRPLYCLISAIIIYAIVAGRTNMRNNEVAYFLKYILCFIFVVLFGVENIHFFGNKQNWYFCYIGVALFLLFGFYKILKLK